ncbi:MAG: MucBP domain-containing protein [Oscillospiraceae bacterium]|nr:MucBP domain-containing protein [Oscillospiraceae bacterium]
MKRMFGALLLLILLLSISPCIYAEEYKEKFTVTVDGGSHGAFATGDTVVLSYERTGTGLWNSTEFRNNYPITLDSDKYYLKGFHISGHSEDTANVTVDRDLMIVDYYGVKGDQVAYYVEYKDRQGNAIADTEELYGNVGDKPVVAFKFIDGYTPYNTFAFTTSEGLKKGDPITFTFVYDKVGSGDGGVIYDDTLIYTTGGSGGGSGATPANGEGQEGPAEIVDIDDPNPPTAGPTTDPTTIDDPSEPGSKPTISEWIQQNLLAIIGAIAILTILLLLIFLLIRRRREEDDDEDEEDE